MRRWFGIEEVAIMPAAPIKGGENPPQDRFAAEEGHTQRFAISREQLFSRQRAAQCAAERAPDYNWKRIVEPDYRCGSRTHEIANDGVVAVHDPTVLRQRFGGERTKFIRRSLGPVRQPVKRVKLDSRAIQQPGKSPSEGRLAGATGADDDDTFPIAFHSGNRSRFSKISSTSSKLLIVAPRQFLVSSCVLRFGNSGRGRNNTGCKPIFKAAVNSWSSPSAI